MESNAFKNRLRFVFLHHFVLPHLNVLHLSSKYSALLNANQQFVKTKVLPNATSKNLRQHMEDYIDETNVMTLLGEHQLYAMQLGKLYLEILANVLHLWNQWVIRIRQKERNKSEQVLGIDDLSSKLSEVLHRLKEEWLENIERDQKNTESHVLDVIFESILQHVYLSVYLGHYEMQSKNTASSFQETKTIPKATIDNFRRIVTHLTQLLKVKSTQGCLQELRKFSQFAVKLTHLIQEIHNHSINQIDESFIRVINDLLKVCLDHDCYADKMVIRSFILYAQKFLSDIMMRRSSSMVRQIADTNLNRSF